MTSNIGSDIIQNMIGSPIEEIKKLVKPLVTKTFRPEFLNRIDEIIVFHSLEKKHLQHIIELELTKVSTRLESKGVHIAFDESVKRYLAERGYDPQFGARPMKRLIQNTILDELALRLLEDKLTNAKKISVAIKNDKAVFKAQ